MDRLHGPDGYAGLKDEAESSNWLTKAVGLAGVDGPQDGGEV